MPFTELPKYDSRGFEIKADARGNQLFANSRGDYSREAARDVNGKLITANTAFMPSGETIDISKVGPMVGLKPAYATVGTGSNRPTYTLGYDTELLPYYDDNWLKTNLPELAEEMKGYERPQGKYDDVITEYFHRVGMPNATSEQGAQRKNQLSSGFNYYSTVSPELLQKFGGDKDKAKAFADRQKELVALELTGRKPDKSLESFAKAVAIAFGAYGAVGSLGASSLGSAGTAGAGASSGSGYSAGVSSATGAGGGLSGGAGASGLAGGAGSDLLGTEAYPTGTYGTGVGDAFSGGSGVNTVGDPSFSLSKYLGLDGLADTAAGRAVSGIQDAFSSPYGQAAKTGNTVRTALGNLDRNEANALKAAAVGGLSLAANSMGGSNNSGSSSSFNGFGGFTDNPNYQKTVTPSYQSIFAKFQKAPNAMATDPYEKFFNANKKNFAEGGDVEGGQLLRKAVGYTGAPDDTSWQTWLAAPENTGAKQNYAQSMASIKPDATKDPYASYGQGPEKLFFENLDKPVNSSGIPVGSKQEDIDFNQAAKKKAGYTGGYDDPNEFFQWSLSNPDSFVGYLQNLHSTNSDFTPAFVTGNALDWNPNIAGNQNFGPTLNAALGRYIGYTGPVGSGQLGSGLQNDYLVANPDKLSTYEALRSIVDPTYKWKKNFAKGGMTYASDGDTDSDAGGGPVKGAGTGKDDKIPAMLSDGEHVITAQEVSALGDGSNDAGQKRLYEMRKRIREHATMNKGGHSPKSKQITSYLRGL